MKPDFKPNMLAKFGSRNASVQNVVSGLGIGFSAGVFVSLNLLGAGGGRPASAHVVQTANAILSSVWFFSACIGGTYLSFFGPAVTMCFGICTYVIYVGSLWYYERFGQQEFPLSAGAIIGIGAGAVFITSGYIQLAYSNEKNRGKFIAIQNNLQAVCSIICSILPVVLNRSNESRDGVPPAFYITLMIIMLCMAVLSHLTLRRIGDLKNADGSKVGQHERKPIMEEFKTNLSVFKEWQLLIMIPAFLPAGSFLIYLGSVNAFQNNLRVRSLLSFIAVVVQIPFGHLLHLILDRPRWSSRKRALVGLAYVGIPLCAAWLWEIIRTRGFDRKNPPATPTDWAEPAFWPALVLFSLNWTASILWQYLVPWFIGALVKSPTRLSHYMGVQRGFLAAGEAICFGIDAAQIPYVAFSGLVFSFYAAGLFVLAYLGMCHIPDAVVDEKSQEDSGSAAEVL